MKIAIVTQDLNHVSPHFGQSTYVVIYSKKDDQIVSKEVLETPPHAHGSLPLFLHEHDVCLVICHGIGKGAIQVLQQVNIQVISGIEGKLDTVIQQFIEGELTSKENTCEGHHHHGDDHHHDH